VLAPTLPPGPIISVFPANGKWSGLSEPYFPQDREDYSVGISEDGSTIALFSPSSDSKPGHVQIQCFDVVTWLQVGQDIPSIFNGNTESALFVSALSGDGSTVAIGSMHSFVVVYRLSQAAWLPIGSVFLVEASVGGLSLSTNGSVDAIGMISYIYETLDEKVLETFNPPESNR
jgi:hypothetical protein